MNSLNTTIPFSPGTYMTSGGSSGSSMPKKIKYVFNYPDKKEAYTDNTYSPDIPDTLFVRFNEQYWQLMSEFKNDKYKFVLEYVPLKDLPYGVDVKEIGRWNLSPIPEESISKLVCECGSDSVRGPGHAHYCPKFVGK